MVSLSLGDRNFFKVLKSGCRLEAIQLAGDARFN